jgi:uncharacterized repeat protein (TIGR03803 family)
MTSHFKFAAPFLSLIFAATTWAANVPKTLHDFAVKLGDGSSAYSSLPMDASGNLYGTTVSGGAHNQGIVFELSPTASGPWREKILYSFKGGQDGADPHPGVILDTAGNLYGATVEGGISSRKCSRGCGVIYKLTETGGQWTESVLHQFNGTTDGGTAYAGLTFDAAGNLYGATQQGGAKGFGTVFELTNVSGSWQEIVLYNFGGKPDGAAAYGTPAFDSAGNLYGTTYAGGANNQGTVYQLTKQSSGAWTEQILHNFAGGADGAQPFAGVIFDQAGNLYGTTSAGGSASSGTAFELVAASGWSETILHTFLGLNAGDGSIPNGLIFDPSGNLYGTTVGGGQFNPGTIFKLTPNAGSWQETVLYSFTGGDDGAYPSAALTMDPAGNLYGTTLWGGPAGDTVGGVAFQFVP